MSARLDLLRPYLSRYKRRFTVLDFGAGINVPAIGAEIAREFDAVVVCVEKDIVTPEMSPRTIWLKKEFTAADLQLMSECEHFDAVIGFNICHWFGVSALKVAGTLRKMGRYVFLQSPHGDDEKAIETFGNPVPQLDRFFHTSGWNWHNIGQTVQFPQHSPRPVWMSENWLPTVLSRTCVSAHADSAHTLIRPEFDKYRAQTRKNGSTWADWITGINLSNFMAWNGIYPTRDAIVEWLKDYPLPATRHGDITPHNFIIDGDSVHLIDGHENWGGDDRENLNLTIQKVMEA